MVSHKQALTQQITFIPYVSLASHPRVGDREAPDPIAAEPPHSSSSLAAAQGRGQAKPMLEFCLFWA